MKLETAALKATLKQIKNTFWILIVLSLLLASFMVRALISSNSFDIIMLIPVLTGITAVLEQIKIKKYEKVLEQRD